MSTWKEELLSFQANVPECLKTKSVFLKWEEEPPSVHEIIIQVDQYGFFLSYTSDLEKEIISIDLSQISDVRFCFPKEKVRETLESFSKEPLSDRSFSIVYGSSLVDVNFLRICSWSVHIAKEWVKAINILIASRRFRNPSVTTLLSKQYAKVCSMQNSSGKIPIKNICKCLNATRFEQRFYDGMQTLQLPHLKNDEVEPVEFTLDHFNKLYTFLCPRQDLDQIFTKMCGGRAPFLKLKQLVKFLNEEQRDPRLNEILFPFYCHDKASKLVIKYEPSPELSQTNRMGFDGLARFLMSSDNLILKKSYLSEEHDLNHPLSHYFIYSSHNTYLIGRQFGGKSSVEMYRQSLLAGCRCIELDCWDGLNDEPIITHGRALCSNILFKDVIVAIKETAFVATPLPLILSFENHCSLLQQRKLAEYCIEIFGEMLLDKPLDAWPLEENMPLPPPNQLLYKIIIKNKKLAPEIEKELLTLESINNQDKPDVTRDDVSSVAGDQSGLSRSITLSGKGNAPQKRLSVINEGIQFTDIIDEGELAVEDSDDSNKDDISVMTFETDIAYFEEGDYSLRQTKSASRDLNKNEAEKLQKERMVVSNGGSQSLVDVFLEKTDAPFSNSKKAGSTSDITAMGDTKAHDRFESPKFTVSDEDVSLHMRDSVESIERVTHANRSIGSVSSDTSSIKTSEGRIQSHRVNLPRSSSNPSLRRHGINRNASGELQDTRHQKLITASSVDDVNDSDDEARRGNSRSSSTTSSSTVNSSLTRHSKKSSRGTSFSSEDEESFNQQFSSQKNVIDPLLSSLVNYVQPMVFQNFESSEERCLSFKISSFNECSGIHLVKTGPVEFTKYNNRQFSRIYPKGTRVDSTNYNPQAFWNVGCQLVTLNLQTTDVPYQLNQAKFEANGQLGYLLKPEIMRRPEKAFDPFTESPIDGIIPATVTVKVISGQFLTDKKCQTYVMVELFGLPADTKRKNKTKLSSSNFMNTLFGDECFVFTKVILPELALLKLTVYDESDKILGQRVLPLDGVQPGYRHVPLRTESGQPTSLSTLFVHITLKTYVPEKFADFADRLFDPMKYQTEVDKRREQMQVFDISEMEEESTGCSNQPKQSITSLFSISSSIGSPLFHLAENRKSFGKVDSGTNLMLLGEGDEKIDEPVSFEDLKSDKQFVKLVKKHQKDVDMLEKRHDKERVQLQKSNQSTIEKIRVSYQKYKLSEERLYEKASKKPGTCRPDGNNDLLAKYNQKMQYLEQRMNEKLAVNASKISKEEKNLTTTQAHERVGLRLYQIAEQLEYLKILLSQAQRNEEKLLKDKLDREMAELKKRQAKQSIEEAKNLNSDRSIKSKEEKERLQRERDKQNMSLFILERQELMRCHEKEMEALSIKHKEEVERMVKEHNQIMEMEKGIFRKVTLAKQTDNVKLSKVSQRI
ncbi:1-phosphatidylinositol 4,5-bisphosphate phosphodiesterase beta-4-like isoform X2 [Rhopilema esculentum]|uniref:1-phosphatidylinositol 4,5-bisphosphate phosphodiesterase beta-4-like isoform X2 n=1 Tax=Rhopilema esculentum TaxID=499914 RepID=UPI0031D2E469